MPATEPGIPAPMTCWRKLRLRRPKSLEEGGVAVLGGPTHSSRPLSCLLTKRPLGEDCKGGAGRRLSSPERGLLGEIRGGFREEGKSKQKVRGWEGLV